MLPNKLQFGYEGLNINGITIHNNGSEKSAQEVYDDIASAQENINICHFLVDESEVIQTMPLDWAVYQVAHIKNWVNSNTIAVDICRSRSLNELYLPAQEKAINLIKELMETYNLTTNDLYLHKDFERQTYCPHRILDIYGNKSNFIKENFKEE